MTLVRYLRSTPSLLQPSYQILCDISNAKQSFVFERDDPALHRERTASLRTSFLETYGRRANQEVSLRSIPYMAGHVEASSWLNISLKKESLFSAVLMTYKPGFQQRPPQIFGSSLIPFIETHSPHMLFRREVFERVVACERIKNGSQNGSILYHDFVSFEEQHESSRPLVYAKQQSDLDKEYENRCLAKEVDKLNIKQTKIAIKIEKEQLLKETITERELKKEEQKEKTRKRKELERERRETKAIRRIARRTILKEQALRLLESGKIKCKKCNEELPISSFHKNARMLNGHSPYCKKCRFDYYYVPNRQYISLKARDWLKAHPEKAKASVKKQKAKPHNRIKFSLTKRVKQYLRGKGLLDTYRSLINCSPKQLVAHFESKFTSQMSWDNYGSYWHIDHIIPCAAFDWAIKSHIHWCWDHRNLQPLSGEENSVKSDSLPSGESARMLRETNMERLKEVVGPLLEQAGIATAVEYTKSWDEVKEPICLAI